MTDIVERLRDPIANYDPLHAQAATEIERVRFELKAAQNEIEIADGEIERLQGLAEEHFEAFIALRDENEWLRADKKALEYQVDHFLAEVSRAEIEIKDLTAALKAR